MRAAWLLCVVLPVTLSACGGKQVPPFASSGSAEAALVLPPTAETEGAVRTLKQRKDRDARWTALHYLVDLFDFARLSQDTAARTLIFRATGVTAARGASTTDAVLDTLLIETDALLDQDRLDVDATAARTLLSWDRSPPTRRSELFARMSALKLIAQRPGPLAVNAELRMFAFCRTAFRDAARARPQERLEQVALCLYPLYDADPDPYFHADRRLRPPPPDWRELAKDSTRRLSGIAKGTTRLAPLAAALLSREQSFWRNVAPSLPVLPDPIELELAQVRLAEPYAYTPLFDPAAASDAAALARALEVAVRADGRGRVAVLLPGKSSSAALLAAAQTATTAGARAVELAVAVPQTLRVPTGDYWSGRSSGATIVRLGVLPFALLSAQASTSTTDPRATTWDPAQRNLGVILHVSKSAFTLSSQFGTLPAISDDAALGPALLKLHAAYPDEAGLVLALDPDVTIARVASTALAATRGPNGEPLFTFLAVSGTTTPLNAKTGTFAARVARRSGAQVTVAPRELEPATASLRLCYLDALDRTPGLAGSVSLEPKDGDLQVTQGPKDPALRTCIRERLAPALGGAPGAASIRVELIPAP